MYSQFSKPDKERAHHLLFKAVESKCSELLKDLLQMGVSIDVKNEVGVAVTKHHWLYMLLGEGHTSLGSSWRELSTGDDIIINDIVTDRDTIQGIIWDPYVYLIILVGWVWVELNSLIHLAKLHKLHHAMCVSNTHWCVVLFYIKKCHILIVGFDVMDRP